MNPIFEVTPAGVKAPTFDEVRAELVRRMKLIFGDDIVLSDDSPDGQLLSVFALALSDVNAEAVKLYSQFSPLTASGVGLDSAVKTNGLKRGLALGSTVDLRLIGQAGTVIKNGMAQDTNRNLWVLPEVVTIPSNGEITVTAKAKDNEAYTASAGSVTLIATPVRGWQSVTNPAPAIAGVPVESDSSLRARQKRSTAKPSRSLWEGVVGEILDIDGVKRVAGIRNDGDVPTKEGVPAHSIALLVDGGAVGQIADTIHLKGGVGCGTYGDIKVNVIDKYGFPNTVSFSRPKDVPVYAKVIIRPTQSYLTVAEGELKARVAGYIDGLSIGESVNLTRVLTVASTSGCRQIDDRFDIDGIELGRSATGTRPQTLRMAWKEAAMCSPENVQVIIDRDGSYTPPSGGGGSTLDTGVSTSTSTSTGTSTGTDAGTNVEMADGGTQTVGVETADGEVQTTPAVTAEGGTQTDAQPETAPAERPRMVDASTQLGLSGFEGYRYRNDHTKDTSTISSLTGRLRPSEWSGGASVAGTDVFFLKDTTCQYEYGNGGKVYTNNITPNTRLKEGTTVIINGKRYLLAEANQRPPQPQQ